MHLLKSNYIQEDTETILNKNKSVKIKISCEKIEMLGFPLTQCPILFPPPPVIPLLFPSIRAAKNKFNDYRSSSLPSYGYYLYKKSLKTCYVMLGQALYQLIWLGDWPDMALNYVCQKARVCLKSVLQVFQFPDPNPD